MIFTHPLTKELIIPHKRINKKYIFVDTIQFLSKTFLCFIILRKSRHQIKYPIYILDYL